MNNSHSYSTNYQQWTLDDEDDNHVVEPRVRSPPSRPPPSRKAPSLNDHQDDHESLSFGNRIAGTSWLGHIAEEVTPPPPPLEVHCDEANNTAWDMTENFNRAYYRTGLWDEGCLQHPYSFDTWSQPMAENSVRESRSRGVTPPQQYDVVEGENKFNHHSGKLETRYYNGGGGDEAIYYLRLQDIVNYVSRGCSISDEHLESIIEYVKSNVQIDNWFEEIRYTISGIVYKKSMPAIKNHQYPIVAKYCLDWMISNPEKVSMPGM